MIGRSTIGLCALLMAAALSPSRAEAQESAADAAGRPTTVTLCECWPGKPGQKPALFVVNGERVDPATLPWRRIDPAGIESVRIVKGAEAVERYGDEARDGAVLITTKPGAAGLVSVSPDAPPSPRCGTGADVTKTLAPSGPAPNL